MATTTEKASEGRATSGWNPRFLEYAAANGRTPEAQLAADALRYPGGRMCGFIAWVTSRSTVAS